MVARDKWVATISKLLRLTQESQIRWQLKRHSGSLAPGERTPAVYTTEYAGQRLRLYEFHRKHVFFGPLSDEPETDWERGLRLEFLDKNDTPLYSVEDVAGIGDLLDAVKYKTANIDEFLEKLISA